MSHSARCQTRAGVKFELHVAGAAVCDGQICWLLGIFSEYMSFRKGLHKREKHAL